ncbi:MAG: phosphohistidine phosphatase SixA [Spirochaetales bacterium]|nr:phosphohistidine phosphatase SixA [Spirochaetales bacterium]
MYLYLVQHAKAMKADEGAERGITEEGEDETRRVAQCLHRVKPEIHVIWQSGRKRARETAEIIGEELDCERRIMEHSHLGPTEPVEPVVTLLENNHNNIMIVGHLPYLSRLSSQLITGSQELPVINFTNSAVACLEKTDAQWTVCWMLTPEAGI